MTPGFQVRGDQWIKLLHRCGKLVLEFFHNSIDFFAFSWKEVSKLATVQCIRVPVCVLYTYASHRCDHQCQSSFYLLYFYIDAWIKYLQNKHLSLIFKQVSHFVLKACVQELPKQSKHLQNKCLSIIFKQVSLLCWRLVFKKCPNNLSVCFLFHIYSDQLQHVYCNNFMNLAVLSNYIIMTKRTFFFFK